VSRRLGIPLLVLGVVLLVLGVHYVPVLLAAKDAKDGAQRLSDELHAMTPADLNHDRLAQLQTQIDGLHDDVGTLKGFLTSDPLVGLARGMGSTRDLVTNADSLMAAASDLSDAGEAALALGNQFVALRQGGADQSLLAGVVKLMATSTGAIDHVHDLLTDAKSQLATIPQNANGQIRHIADLMDAPLVKYLPLLDQYRAMDGVLPGILGWSDTKRYLVLAMDPAELRPAGGYTGTVGTVTFENGSLTQHEFSDVYKYDTRTPRDGVPFVEPPIELQNHLLGDQSWQLADAAWSPDFPTAAQNSLKLYSAESGDTDIDGVIALTTYAVDRLMQVTGPVMVGDGYNVTVKPGDVTLTALGQTRGNSGTDPNRKGFLNSLANTVLDKVMTLPPDKWTDLYNAFQDISSQRLMQVWLKDPTADALVAKAPLGGALDQAPGDYVYVVEANVQPPSKYSLVVSRTDELSVTVGPDGSATDTLKMNWQNDAMLPGEPYASIRSYSTSDDGIYGDYVRLVTKGDTQFQSASGQAADPITDVETNDTEENHNVVGNYLLIEPGSADLTYKWLAPGAATKTGSTWLYRLTLQRQPAIGPKSVTVNVTLPDGATVQNVSPGATATGNSVTFDTPLTTDQVLQIRYSLP
jgi:Protein of unknown function (DUF4012)